MIRERGDACPHAIVAHRLRLCEGGHTEVLEWCVDRLTPRRRILVSMFYAAGGTGRGDGRSGVSDGSHITSTPHRRRAGWIQGPDAGRNDPLAKPIDSGRFARRGQGVGGECAWWIPVDIAGSVTRSIRGAGRSASLRSPPSRNDHPLIRALSPRISPPLLPPPIRTLLRGNSTLAAPLAARLMNPISRHLSPFSRHRCARGAGGHTLHSTKRAAKHTRT